METPKEIGEILFPHFTLSLRKRGYFVHLETRLGCPRDTFPAFERITFLEMLFFIIGDKFTTNLMTELEDVVSQGRDPQYYEIFLTILVDTIKQVFRHGGRNGFEKNFSEKYSGAIPLLSSLPKFSSQLNRRL